MDKKEKLPRMPSLWLCTRSIFYLVRFMHVPPLLYLQLILQPTEQYKERQAAHTSMILYEHYLCHNIFVS